MVALRETLKVEKLSVCRGEFFGRIRDAAKLKKGEGPELEASEYRMNSALSLAKTLHDKLKLGMEEMKGEKEGKVSFSGNLWISSN